MCSISENDEISGLEVLKSEENKIKNLKNIETYDNSINEFLNGGIRRGLIFEICGLCGVGKTTLCYELLIPFIINCIINKSNEKVLFIDSESGFNPNRLYNIICFHLNKMNYNEIISVSEVMNRILFIRILESDEMNKIGEKIDKLIESNENIKLIIIDSICYYYRNEISDTIRRAQKLAKFGLYLTELCLKNNITIITTNHLSSRIIIDNNNNEYISVLGDTWSEIVNIRIKMYKMDENLIMIGMKGLKLFNPICYLIDENGLKSLSN